MCLSFFHSSHPLRWVHSLLSSGLLSSAPTHPSNEESTFSETGTNKEVSGALGVESLDEKFLTGTPEAACCFCLRKDTTSPGAWLRPAQVQAARELKWRWRRESSSSEQRVVDMARFRFSRSVHLSTWRQPELTQLSPRNHAAVQSSDWNNTLQNVYRGRSTPPSCLHNVGKDPLLCRCSQTCLIKIRALR